ncbi:hypothetical protein [Trueperella pyogenes]|uniref:hypothetical protein n=1 Tax=Trueperella pyogenes TaxID=1661 RepID=UPI001432D3C3|nr:hypothetical protein [Trueperella pyogenes]QIU86685.1 hypothetical protein HEP79_05245 [Trueperella pyogenes]
MNIRITYPGGRIDVFDTGAYATSAPFDSKNMLTDFEIGLGDIEEEGLWLVANYYAAKPEFRKGAAGIPLQAVPRMEIPTLPRRRPRSYATSPSTERWSSRGSPATSVT